MKLKPGVGVIYIIQPRRGPGLSTAPEDCMGWQQTGPVTKKINASDNDSVISQAQQKRVHSQDECKTNVGTIQEMLSLCGLQYEKPHVMWTQRYFTSVRIVRIRATPRYDTASVRCLNGPVVCVAPHSSAQFQCILHDGFRSWSWVRFNVPPNTL